MKRIKIRLETLSHYAVILIALLAFVVSVLQLRIQHDHNKLSVKPILNSTVEQNDTILAPYIKNKGVGPAIITEATFTYKGKTYESIETLLRESGLIKKRIGGYTLNDGTVISANESRLLVKLRGRELKGVGVFITYESVYKDVYQLSFDF